MPQIPAPDDEEKRRRDEQYAREVEQRLAQSAAAREADMKRGARALEINKGVQDRLDAMGPLPGPLKIKPMGYDEGGEFTERRVAPAEDDPKRDYSPLGRSSWTDDLSRPVAPEEPVGSAIGVGSGGPEDPMDGPLTQSQIVNLKQWQADRESGAKSVENRARVMGGIDPEKSATALELAGKAGVTRLEVEQNLDAFSAQSLFDRLDSLKETAPKLKTWLDASPDNFDIAHDDTESLSWWDQVGQSFSRGFARTDELKAQRGKRDGAGMGALTEYPLGDDLRPGVADASGIAYSGRVIGGSLAAGFARTSSGIYGLGRAASELNDQFASFVAGRPVESGVSKWLAERQDAERGKAETWRPKIDDPTLSAALQGIESLPTSAFTIATALMSGGAAAPLVGAAVGGGVTAGDEYGTARSQGMDPLSSAGYGMTQGLIEAGFEIPQLKFLVGDLTRQTPFGQMLFKQALVQGITEQGAEHSQDFVAWAFLPENKGKTIDDYLAERPAAAYQTLIASLVGTGVQTSTAKLLDEGLKALDAGYQQKRAEDLANMIRAMGENAKDSKLLTRLPDKFREYAAYQTQGTPAENVLIDGEAFNELAQEVGGVDSLAQAFRVDPADVNAAIESGDYVVVPSGNYAAVIQTAKKELGVSGETIFTKLEPNVKFNPNQDTAKEREAFAAIYAAEAKERADSEVNYADAVERVGADIAKRVEDTKLYGKDAAFNQAEILKAIVTTLPLRMGEDVETLWKEQGFNILASITGEQDGDALAMGGDRAAIEVDDAIVQSASEQLSEYDFLVWKAAALEGRTNKDIADDADIAEVRKKNGADLTAMPSVQSVQVILSKARALGLPVPGGETGRPKSEQATRIEKMIRAGLSTRAIHDALGRTGEQYNATKTMVSKIKKAMRETADSLAQGKALAQSAYAPQSDRPEVVQRHVDRLNTTLESGTLTEVEAAQQAIRDDTDVRKVELADIVAAVTGHTASFSSKEAGHGIINVHVDQRWKLRQHSERYAAPETTERKKFFGIFQGERGTFTPREDRSIIRLFQSRNLATLSHEGAHWYLDILYRMSRAENAHPEVMRQWSAILEWQGKHPEWDAMFDADGRFTQEGRDIQEAFAETFEAYLREGKAPSVGLRSVFASFKQWLLRLYKSIAEIGGRVKLNDEIRAVFDRMLATDDAIRAAQSSMTRDSEAMAKALLDKKVITPRQFEKTRERIAAARERAEAALMARLMDEYERNEKAWWNEDERDTRREVQSEVDERPEQRAYQHLTGIWRDTRAEHAEAALAEAEAMDALAHTQWDLNTREKRAAWLERETVSSGIPGETTDAKQWGFTLDDGTGIVVSVAPDPNGEAVIEWTFLDRLKARVEVEDLYRQGGPELSISQIKQLLVRVAAVIEADMREGKRDAYVFTPATEAIGRLNARLLQFVTGGPYEVATDLPGGSDVLILHKDAKVGPNGRIIPRPENQGKRLQWDEAGDAEARKDAFYAQIEALARSIRPDRPGADGPSPDGAGGRSLAHSVGKSRQLDAMGFYSALREAVANSPQNKASAAQWKATLSKLPGVKAEEIEWTGVNDWLDAIEKDGMMRMPNAEGGFDLVERKAGAITREELLGLLTANGVKVEQKELGAQNINEGSQYLYPSVERAIRGARTPYDMEMQLANDGDAYRTLTKQHPELFEEEDSDWAAVVVSDLLDGQEAQNDGPTQFDTYTLPGGTNYTELLLTLPAIKGPATHWDEPNVVAHARFKERRGPNGEKVLALEEIQSDWHQKGRKEGYETEFDPEKLKQAEAAVEAANKELAEADASVDDILLELRGDPLKAVLDGIVADNHGLADGIEAVRQKAQRDGIGALSGEVPQIILKRGRASLRRALGYMDGPAGSEQKVQFNRAQRAIRNRDQAMLRVSEARQARSSAKYPDGIPRAPFANNGWVNLVLKRMIRYAAENGFDTLAWVPGNIQNGSEVEADDNRGDFYDKIVPAAANKLGKKYGAEVRSIGIRLQGRDTGREIDRQQFHALPITPELKAAATEGFPLFHSGDGSATTTPPPEIPPMRLNLQAVKDQYGEEALSGIPPEVAAYSAEATDVDQFVQLARDVKKGVKQKRPRSLWKFLSTQRKTGEVSYSGIRDPDGEILAIIDKKKEAPGLIADETKDSKKSRSYDIEQAATAAWEEGYFQGESPPSPREFLDALRGDVSGTNRVYRTDDQAKLADIDNAEQWAEWFDANGVDITADQATIREQLATVLTGQQENAIGPDEAAPFFKMRDGKELLEALKQGPKRNQIIREETRRRMIEKHGDVFNDGTIMAKAEEYARNEIQHRQFEIELEALANAAGKQASANLAKQTAIEALRSKQVREVLNYNQWLILERRYSAKALQAAEKGDMAKAAEYARFRLINSMMFSEGRKLAEEIEKDRKHLLGYDAKTKRARLFAAGKDYADQMAGLLSDYQFRPESKKGEQKRTARGVWIQQQMAGIDPFAAYADPTKSPAEQQAAAAEALERSQVLAKLAEGTEARNFKSLTVEELQAVRDEADLIWRLATLKDKLIKEGERRRLSLAGEDIAAEVIANQPNEKPPEPIETDTAGEKVKSSLRQYFARHRTMQSLARQFAGGKDNGVFWRYIVRPLNEAFSKLSTLRKQMGEDVVGLFGVYSKAEQERMYRDRMHFAGIGRSLTTQGRLAIALNWGNEKNRRRIMDAYGWNEAQVQEVLNSLDKRDWDFVQATWDYLDTWFPEANRVHESVHGASMDKEAPLAVATRFGVYKGGYYPIKFDPKLSSKAGQRAVEADAKMQTGQVGTRTKPGSTIKRVSGKVALPLRLSVFDVVTSHLDEVAKSIATEETLFDAGRIIKQKAVEDAIVGRHGRQVYDTLVAQLVTAKFGMEGTSGLLAHLRNGATVVGLSWKVATASLQILGVSNSIVRTGGPWVAMGYARMGKDAATLTSSANWIMERSEFMRHRRQNQSPEVSSLLDAVKTKWTPDFIAKIIPRQLRAAHNMMVRNGFALMSNVQFYSVDMPTWYGAFFKAQAAGYPEADAVAMADQAVIDAQGGGEIHQLAAMQSGAGTKYAALLRILTNFMSYMVTTYNLGAQKVRNARTAGQIAALSLDMVLLAAVPVAGKMLIDAMTKGVGDDDEPEEWMERYLREQVAFVFGPLVGISQFAGSARGDDAYGYKGPAGLAIFNELNALGVAVAEGDFDASFWRPANRAMGMALHYPASQVDATIRGAQAYFNGETDNPAAIFFGPPPAN